MKAFFAKLLLFGEYGLMFGARALALPFNRYSGMLVKPGATAFDTDARQSSVELERFASWFQHEQLNAKMNFPLDLERLRQDITGNLYFRSDIPLEYGLGSSGALCAALFDEYSIYCRDPLYVGKKHSLPEALKHDFSVMESYFHGKSSGLDPLVSFFHQPVLFENNHILLPHVTNEKLGFQVCLIDTGAPGATSPLVSRFLEKMQDPDFNLVFNSDYLPANDGAVQAFLARQPDQLFRYLRLITRFQLDYLTEMIPAGIADHIEQLLSHGICVKLLGSGGGGFLLAFIPADADAGLLRNAQRAF
ncbi:MAG: hypothetical protein AAGU19_13910 [Prolixibacteraceae bacterium]